MGNAITPNNPPLQEKSHKYGYPQAGVCAKIKARRKRDGDELEKGGKEKGGKKRKRRYEGVGISGIT